MKLLMACLLFTALALAIPSFAADPSETGAPPESVEVADRDPGASPDSQIVPAVSQDQKIPPDLDRTGWRIDRLRLTGAAKPGVRHLYVTGRFHLSADAVWRAIAYGSETDWPSIKDAVVEQTNGDTVISRYKIAVPIVRDRRYRLRVINDDARMIERFEQVHGYGNVNSIDGYWQVFPLSDDMTRVDYVLDTDPGVSLVPSFIINWATKHAVPSLYDHIYKTAMRDAARLDRGSR